MEDGTKLLDWYPRHIVAIVFQCLSLLGSLTIIFSFLLLKQRRSPFRFQILFLNIADVVWTTSHLINHIEAVANGHAACSTMGMFTHLGIGWELCWLISIAIYTVLLVKNAETGKVYKPSYRLKVIVTCAVWLIPLIWWTIIGLSVDAYDNSSGYFCWVKFEPVWISVLFADAPLLICFVIVSLCYGYVILTLLRRQFDKQMEGSGKRSFSREIRRSLLYIVVYVLWVHPYLAITLVTMTGGTPSRGLWIYFLLMINSLGLFNFFAYGYSERWFNDMRNAFGCGVEEGSTTIHLSGTESGRASQAVSRVE